MPVPSPEGPVRQPTHMAIRSFLLLFVSGIVLAACSSRPIPSSSAKGYDLDLSAFRPKYEAGSEKGAAPEEKTRKPAPTMSDQPLFIQQKLDYSLDTLATRNRNARYIAGYKIQLYTGTSRSELDAAKVFVYQTYPELDTYVAYNHPTYRLRIGDFGTRLDVEKYLNKLKDDYPSATIVSDRVLVSGALKIMDSRAAVKEDEP